MTIIIIISVVVYISY